MLGMEALAGKFAVLCLRAHHANHQKHEQDYFHGAA
jgi:hypothetical protein